MHLQPHYWKNDAIEQRKKRLAKVFLSAVGDFSSSYLHLQFFVKMLILNSLK